MASISQEAPKRWRINGWKIGFFIALFAFEVTREWAVVVANEEPRLAANGTVSAVGGLVSAEGRWTRIDGGEKLVPAIIQIDCWRDSGKCTQADVQVHDRWVYAPTIQTFDAQFAPDAVTYEDTSPVCVSYTVRIDLRLKKAFAVRTRKANNSPGCAQMEPRMETVLGKGFDDSEASTDHHFLPLLSILMAVGKVF